MPTLGELIAARVPGVRRRTLSAALDCARPESFQHTVTVFTKIDDESIRRLQAQLERLTSVLHWRSIMKELGNPETGGDFERALHARLLRIVEDAVPIALDIQRERREHPVLDLSGLPVAPAYNGDRPVAIARYVASHCEAHGILHLASYDPETGLALTWEIWKYPGGGRGGEWREQHREDFDEGWVRDPREVVEVSPREVLIREVTTRINDRKTAEALVAAHYRATKDERGNRPDMSAQVERIVAAYGCLVGIERPAPKTIRDLVRDLSGIDDVDDAIREAIPCGLTPLLSPDFMLDRASMRSMNRKLHNEEDFAAGRFPEWTYLQKNDPARVIESEHRVVLDVVRDAVLKLLTR